jgi:hypothetical protein
VQLPPFDEHGNLPAEIFPVSLSEAIEHFGRSSVRREMISTRLERIHEIATATGHLKRFIVFGSFVTAKPDPNDIDVFIIMDDDFDLSGVDPSAVMLFDHASAQSNLGASAFWVRSIGALGGEDVAIRDWMLTREGLQRGIIEIIDKAT